MALKNLPLGYCNGSEYLRFRPTRYRKYIASRNFSDYPKVVKT